MLLVKGEAVAAGAFRETSAHTAVTNLCFFVSIASGLSCSRPKDVQHARFVGKRGPIGNAYKNIGHLSNRPGLRSAGSSA